MYVKRQHNYLAFTVPPPPPVMVYSTANLDA